LTSQRSSSAAGVVACRLSWLQAKNEAASASDATQKYHVW
jgi:hypothetical protein